MLYSAEIRPLSREVETAPMARPAQQKKILWYGLLLLTAFLWGVAFVPQRTAMSKIAPLTFNGLRFSGGALLVGIAAFRRWSHFHPRHLKSMFLLGTLLFLAAASQQIGMVSASAAQGGFITGLSIVLVPIQLAIVFRQRTSAACWTGALLGLIGLAFLTLRFGESISIGALWLLLCATLYASHVIAVERTTASCPGLLLAAGQYAVCGALSLIVGVIFEPGSWRNAGAVMPELTYMIIASIGIAYTLQVIAQRHVPAANAQVVMSLESVFAAIAGWLIIGERLSALQLTGCALMFAGMLIAQLDHLRD